MAGLLGEIFSAGNVARRKLTDLLGNPVLSAQQMLGNLNDRARVLNQMTAAAAKEGVAEYGPETRKLAGLLADAYNPIGLTVYHGSPAKFTKFDPTKIGSGEGAQAYGYGHYVAESPGVAKEYSKANQGRNAAAEGLIDELPKRMQMEVFKVMQMPDGNFKEVAKQDLIKKYPESASVLGSKQGNFYEIDLPDEQIAKMLDWDKPLKNQPEALKAIRNQIQDAEIERSFDANVKSGISGANAMQNYVWGKTPADKSEALRNAGIPGIRYLDQSSRGVNQTWVVNNPKFGSYDFPSFEEAQAFIKSNPQDKLELIEPQKTTSNFVVFPGNEDLLTILRRNGGLLGP